MTDFYFARPRHNYASYEDFWRLVELAGFPVVPLDEIDLSADRAYIFTPINGEIYGIGDRPRKAKLIWWMLERFDAGTGDFSKVEEAVSHGLQYADECWVSDRWVSTLDPRLKFVPFGSDPGLRLESPAVDGTQRFDFAHMSYAWGRRADLYAALRGKGYKEAPACWGVKRHYALAHSRCMLNAQQYPGPVTAPLRFALAAAYGLPIITETVRDPAPLEPGALIMASIEDLPALFDRVLRSPDTARLQACAKLVQARLLRQHPFRFGVLEALQ